MAGIEPTVLGLLDRRKVSRIPFIFQPVCNGDVSLGAGRAHYYTVRNRPAHKSLQDSQHTWATYRLCCYLRRQPAQPLVRLPPPLNCTAGTAEYCYGVYVYCATCSVRVTARQQPPNGESLHYWCRPHSPQPPPHTLATLGRNKTYVRHPLATLLLPHQPSLSAVTLCSYIRVWHSNISFAVTRYRHRPSSKLFDTVPARRSLSPFLV